MKISHGLSHLGVLVAGLALGSLGTLFLNKTSAESTPNQQSEYPANAQTNTVAVNSAANSTDNTGSGECALASPALDQANNLSASTSASTQAQAARALPLENSFVANSDINQSISAAKESEKPWLSAKYAGELAETDPVKAYEWATAQSDKTSRDAALSELLWRWAEQDVQGLSEHIANEPDPELQALMYNQAGDQIIEHVGAHDPQAAMHWANAQPTDSQYKLRESAYKRWVEKQPELALNWLKNQPDTIESQSLHSLALPHVLEQDIEFALSMFDSLDPATQTSMTARVVNELAIQRPSDVETWAASISNPHARSVAQAAIADRSLLSRSEELIAELDYKTGSERTTHLHTIMRVLSTGDPDRFTQWLHSDSLSEEDHWVLSNSDNKGKCG